MLVGSIRRILHDANVHRFTDRYSNRLSRFVIDEARRTLEEDIVWVLENIELAKGLQRVVAGALNRSGELKAPPTRQAYSLLGSLGGDLLAECRGGQALRGAGGLPAS